MSDGAGVKADGNLGERLDLFRSQRTAGEVFIGFTLGVNLAEFLERKLPLALYAVGSIKTVPQPQ